MNVLGGIYSGLARLHEASYGVQNSRLYSINQDGNQGFKMAIIVSRLANPFKIQDFN